MFDFSGHTPPKWFDAPMRWAQLTLTDDDPGGLANSSGFDPDRWLDYFKEIKAQGAVIGTGGYIAYHPSALPLQYVSPGVSAAHDVFGYLVERCRRMGMAVIARTDPHAVHQAQKDAHPEWIMTGADGEPRRHWSQPTAWVTCALGPYNFTFMNEVNREIVGRYGVDGIFANRWSGSGLCYCESCRKLFRERTGKELPASRSDPVYTDYIDFQQERLFDLCKLWDDTIRAQNPYARFIPNSGGGALSGLDMRALGDYSDILFADKQSRPHGAPLWSNGKNGKEYRAVMGNKPIGGIFSMGIDDDHRWKDSVQAIAELRLWVAEGTAQGLRPWFTKFHGKIYDRRWMDTVRELYLRYADWEPYLRNTANLAQAGLVYSQNTAKYYAGEKSRDMVEDHIQGAYQALFEGRVPFEMVHESYLEDPAALAPYKVLVLPNIACLSDAACAGLKTWVKAGGAILATLETSRYDERGGQRPDFALTELFGATVAGPVEGPMKNSYLKLERDGTTDTAAVILRGFDNADRIINGDRRVPVVERQQDHVAPLRLIPTYPDLPMEEVFPRNDNPATGTAQLFLREYGAGRVAYFPWDIDRIFWHMLAPDHLRLFLNTLDWLLQEERDLRLEGPGLFDIAVWRQEKSITIHLVNMTNPMFMQGPVRELLPSFPQELTFTLPEGIQPAAVKLLSTGQRTPYTLAGRKLNVSVPPFLDHEVVVIDI
jgi:hypothetical protein